MGRRKHSIIDGFPADLKDAVDEMIKSDFTYREIVNYIKKQGFEISQSSVQRYASSLNATLQSIRMTQENFRAIMDETEKYPNLDATDGILRLLSGQIFNAINDLDPEKISEIDIDTLMKHAVALSKAVTYKKNMDLKNKDIQAVGLEQIQSAFYETMAKENPDLYKQVRKFIKEQKKR